MRPVAPANIDGVSPPARLPAVRRDLPVLNPFVLKAEEQSRAACPPASTGPRAGPTPTAASFAYSPAGPAAKHADPVHRPSSDWLTGLDQVCWASRAGEAVSRPPQLAFGRRRSPSSGPPAGAAKRPANRRRRPRFPGRHRPHPQSRIAPPPPTPVGPLLLCAAAPLPPCRRSPPGAPERTARRLGSPPGRAKHSHRILARRRVLGSGRHHLCSMPLSASGRMRPRVARLVADRANQRPVKRVGLPATPPRLVHRTLELVPPIIVDQALC